MQKSSVGVLIHSDYIIPMRELQIIPALPVKFLQDRGKEQMQKTAPHGRHRPLMGQ